jgi:hypothetical protein
MVRIYPDTNDNNSNKYVRNNRCRNQTKNCIGNIIWLTFVVFSVIVCFAV